MTTESIEWLIVGGGIHGVHIAARLLSDTDLSTKKYGFLIRENNF